MKVTYGCIVYNSDFVFRQMLESIYSHAHAICIAEGTVGYFHKKGLITSSDETNSILENFPDPENKIRIVHGTWPEKDDMCRAWFNLVPPDTDYVFCNDADELLTDENRRKVYDYLEREQPTKLGFKSDTFFGGFERILGGFERDHNFQRILKYEKGCSYLGHRQPRLGVNGKEITGKDITGNQLFLKTGVTMQHYSYVSARQVKEKIDYYTEAVISPGNAIENYFENLWLPWVMLPHVRHEIEKHYGGAHEFLYPKARGECYTIEFTGSHPEVIVRDMGLLVDKFNKQLEEWK